MGHIDQIDRSTACQKRNLDCLGLSKALEYIKRRVNSVGHRGGWLATD